MNTLKENENFVVPFRYVDMEDLDIVITKERGSLENKSINIATRAIEKNINKSENIIKEKKPVVEKVVSQKELNDIKTKIKKQIEYHLIKMKDFTKTLTSDQLLEIHTNIFKDVWMGYVNNMPCLAKVKPKLNLDKLLEYKGNKIFNYHYNKLKGQEIEKVKQHIVTLEEIEAKIKEATIEVEFMFKKVVKMIENISAPQVEEVHEFILVTLIEDDNENIPYLKKVESKLDSDKVEDYHRCFTRRKFNEHLNKLGCHR